MPPLPEALLPLVEIAYNLHWSFNPDAQALFARLDPALWESTGHNPIRMLVEIPYARFEALALDEKLVGEVAKVQAQLRAHLRDTGWYAQHHASLPRDNGPFQVAYFCAEFGLTECFQIYSGGLGLLAGDHLKSATELGLPLIAVGLLYRNGYFHQKLDASGMQQEVYPPLDAPRQPVKRVMDLETGRQLTVGVPLPGRELRCAVWRADVGKVRLYLLDTNIPENTAEDREITANLYLGDQNRRIQQELVLGIGGVRALQAAHESPSVFHMNEGHAAFLALERIRQIHQRTGLSFDQSREAAASAHVFTTHTPVPAGIDHFGVALVQHYFAGYYEQLGLDVEGFLALGRERVEDKNQAFSMAILAIRCSRFCNGVSKLHGVVSRKMWNRIWPETPEGDVPIGAVTNGIHAATWLSPTMGELFDKHLPEGWRRTPQDPGVWKGMSSVSDRELWEARNVSRARFVAYCHDAAGRGLTGGAQCLLDPNALTIGFARRFAGYKRGTLLLRDKARLKALLTSSTRPVQLVISGKSHPGDGWGKGLIKEMVEYTRSSDAVGKVLFIEDYAIDVAREMVQGCDIWLNTPVRGLEASGTSGMKAALNGVMHASILDGWWDEGFTPDAGYKIADSGIYENDAPDEKREAFEADALYRLIEQELIPDFYTRDSGGVATRWTAKMRACIQKLAPEFNTHRMVAEYAQRYYFPAHIASTRLASAGMVNARELSDHIDRYRKHWAQVRVKSVECATSSDGGGFAVSAAVRLGMLRPDEVLVQVYHGPIEATQHDATKPELSKPEPGQTSATASGHATIQQGWACVMACKAPLAGGDGTYHFTAKFAMGPHEQSRPYGVIVRVLPGDDRLVTPFVPGLIANSVLTLAEPEKGGGV